MYLWQWQNLYIVLAGGYDKEEKAARAYDLAALKYWGPTTTTNFPVDIYMCILTYIYISINLYYIYNFFACMYNMYMIL